MRGCMRGERNSIRPVDSGNLGGRLFTKLKQSVLRAGLYARGTIGEVARVVADACGARPEAGRLSTSYGKHISHTSAQGSQSFADLPHYRFMLKHKEIGRHFDIADPFYRCHEARHGVMTQIARQKYVNYASYDYLGLNQHPTVVQAAKAAIESFGTSVSASRIVAGERPLHQE